MTAPVKVGDYDPVTAVTYLIGPLCNQENPARLQCTRPKDHDGDHVACVPGHVAAAVWS